jgi:serine protease Do
MVLAGCIAAVAGPVASQTRTPVESSATDSARSILDRARPAVIQVNGFVSTNTAPNFHGTGFAAAPGGYFVTNYHVVAEHVQEPSKFRLEYKTPDGKTGALKVLAVDVRNDLAIAFAADHAPEPLTFADGKAGKGERAYSIGYPLDVGLTITEGVSNGQVDGQFVPRIHYSGALNGGMSGGPAMNSAGEVLGVNVSHYRFQQSISFFVPAENARSLVIATLEAKADGKSLDKAIVAQARSHASALLAGLGTGVATEVTSGYTLPGKLAPFVDCNANASPSATAPVQAVRVMCSAKAQIYLGQSLTTGNFAYAHTVLTSAKLDAWRFAHRLSAGGGGFVVPGNRRHVGPLACESKVVALKGFDADVSICTRAYRKLTGLYDFSVRVTSVSGASHGFTSSLDMNGMEFDAGMIFIRHFVDAMERKA